MNSPLTMFGAFALGLAIVFVFLVLSALWTTTRIKLRAARKLCPACGKVLGHMAINAGVGRYTESYNKADREKRRKLQYNPRWPIVCLRCGRAMTYDPQTEKFVRN